MKPNDSQNSMMKKLLLALLGVGLVATSTSCASLFGYTSYNVSINSVPSEAQLTITNGRGVEVFSGVTPATVRLKSSEGFFRSASYTLRFTKAGYDEYQTQLSASIQPWYFANILLFVVPGMLIIDPATGAMWQLDQDQVNVRLQPAKSASTAQVLDAEGLKFLAEARSAKSDLQIYSLQDVPASLRSHLVPVDKSHK